MSSSQSIDHHYTALIRADGNGAATLFFRHRRYPASIGPAPVTRHKREGDHATPVGALPIRRVFYRADRTARPETRQDMPVEPLGPNDGWCDDPSHEDYNTLVTLPHPARCETLWRDDASYDIVASLGWNDDPVVPGNGSAIFLHLPTRSGVTEGCIALAEPDLRAVLAAGLVKLVVQD
jgi:L,D-peptidoglycan transpeptidase YkuD (ErfK/YbiS/YcfS/YnhG family)